MRHITRVIASTMMLAAAPAAAHAQVVFQANSAVAGSQFNSGYQIANAINGSGMPSGFAATDVHAPYANGNHWTTLAGAINNGTAWANFNFDQDVAMTAFHMWNHQSNGGHAANTGYGVTLFHLVLRDVNGMDLLTLSNQSAIGTAGTSQAQTYSFSRVTNVRQVHFEILDNQGSTSSYTGLGEVAFSDAGTVSAVPEPASLLLLGTGLTVIAAIRRRRG